MLIRIHIIQIQWTVVPVDVALQRPDLNLSYRSHNTRVAPPHGLVEPTGLIILNVYTELEQSSYTF